MMKISDASKNPHALAVASRVALGAALLAAGFALPAKAALVVNGNFETPGGMVRDPLTANYLSGWTYDGHLTGSDFYEDDSQDGILAADGNHYVSFGHTGTSGGELRQTIATTAGHSYRLSLWTAEQQGHDPDQQFYVLLTTSLGGSYGFTIGNLSSMFAETTQIFNPDGVSTTISITDATPNGLGAGSNLALDRVSVVDLNAATVPEPAQWALLLAGFGFAGVASRRHRRGVVTA